MKVLIAEDDPVSRRILSANLVKWGHEVVSTENGTQAWEALHKPGAPSVAILDWMMPGMDGVEICRRLRKEQAGSQRYLILLTALSRKEKVIEGLEAGADDYLTKPFNGHELRVRLQVGARIIELQDRLRERVKQLEQACRDKERAEEVAKNLSLTDHMTGLYNQRGFFTLAEQISKMGRRNRQSSLLIYCDMDGLKEINDTLGHAVGSVAIEKTADLLRQTFRDCDIIARFGGDEFLVLAPNVPFIEADRVMDRLRDNVDAFNHTKQFEFVLGLSLGAVPINHNDDSTLEKNIEAADTAMYLDKRKRKQERGVANGLRKVRQTLGSAQTSLAY